MPKTTKTKPRKGRTVAVSHKVTPDPRAFAIEERKRLNARIRVERQIVRLAGALERAVQKADRKLMELGGALMARSARVNQLEAQRDMERERAIYERLPQPAE